MSRLEARIARISTVPFFVVTQLKRQIEDIAQAGADVTVITSAGAELQNFAWNDHLRSVTIEIPRQFRPLQDALALVRLVHAFRRGRFDIVHSTTPKAGVLSMIAGRLAGVPIRLHTFTGQTWVTLKGPMYHVAQLADRLIGRFATHCYADSASQRAFLISGGILPAERIDVLGAGSLAGIDVARFDRGRFPEDARSELRDQLGIAPTTPLVLFVGRICEDKGVGELLDALRQVRERGIALELLLVGPFDARRQSLSRESVLAQPGVHHVDFTAVPEQYMALADVLALPSYREGFGTVVIEAAAMGVPAVGSNIYGLSDAIVDGETGMLVPARDSAALGEALVAMLTNSERRHTMARAARQRSLEQFDSRAVSAVVLKEYQTLIDNHRRR